MTGIEGVNPITETTEKALSERWAGSVIRQTVLENEAKYDEVGGTGHGMVYAFASDAYHEGFLAGVASNPKTNEEKMSEKSLADEISDLPTYEMGDGNLAVMLDDLTPLLDVASNPTPDETEGAKQLADRLYRDYRERVIVFGGSIEDIHDRIVYQAGVSDAYSALASVPTESREFHFTDAEWFEYQRMPEQGYSHRGKLEFFVNRWLASIPRTAEDDREK